MSGPAGAVTSSNNMRCKQPHEETHRTWPSLSTLAKITCIVVPIIAYLGQGFITHRPACVQWNKEMQDAEQWAVKQREWYDMALDAYRDRAKLNCDWDWEHSVPFTPRNSEALEFCNAWRKPIYPIEKIPSFWKIKYTQEDLDSNRDDCEGYNRLNRYPMMKLTCFAEDMIIAQHVYERHEKHLNKTLSDKPLLCSRVKKV